MSSDAVIFARDLGKCYQLYDRPQDRLKQFLWRGRRRYFREFWALHAASFEVKPGEVVGIVGRNGSGKSTLLQLICGTLTPTTGEVRVQGRVAALLELGAGFNPEFTGRENVLMNAAILGLTPEETAARFDAMVDFSGVRDFIDQPVKTYSSGMFVRLAFAVAVSVDPDILVIDEALSVGDGEFARKSFERIMALKEAGKTILFCSHSLYQIEAICNRAIWLKEGRIALSGPPAAVVSAYNDYLAGLSKQVPSGDAAARETKGGELSAPAGMLAGMARIESISVGVDGVSGRELDARCGKSTLSVCVTFASDPRMPAPGVAVSILHQGGMAVTSIGSRNDGITLERDVLGCGGVTLSLPELPLLKGEYSLDVYLMCERGIHVYEHAAHVAKLKVSQSGLEFGLVVLPHHWDIG